VLSTYESLSNIPHDALAEKVGGKFRLTRLISQRLQDIHHGAPLLVDRQPEEALLAAVCREIQKDLIKLEVHSTEDIDLHDAGGETDYLGIGGGSEEE
jgi:DNA-directed RNA polymerase subunit K/omega